MARVWVGDMMGDVLEEAGLVETRRENRYKFHHLRTEPLKQIGDRWLKPANTENP